MADAVEALLDGGFGGASDGGDFAEWVVVEVEEEELAVVIVLEVVDEAVEGLVAEVGGFVGEEVVDVLVVFHEEWHSFALADFLAGDVEGDACDPGGGGAFGAVCGPCFPEGADDFLVEVAEVAWPAAGEVAAYLYQDAFALAEHQEEFGLLALVGFHGCLCPWLLSAFYYN